MRDGSSGRRPTELRALDFPAGSMGPKVEAACDFVERTGGMAAIGALADIEAIVEGRAGTIVKPVVEALSASADDSR